ncbi:hypothetical protein SSX86_014606 [Deinandra increscens subsp. villosa]|uniref:PHD-type domain-containing protein n=1 Tax=Deinandra increscens subsp. villosa TaxID=3103831 RepID=A0AAP0D6T4_9ASTR
MASLYVLFLRLMGDEADAHNYSYNLDVGASGRKLTWEGTPRRIGDSYRLTEVQLHQPVFAKIIASEGGCKLTVLIKSGKKQKNMEIIKESVTNKQSFPQGSLISSRLSSHAVGNLLEVHDFLCCFKEVIGVEEPISFEQLEQELLCPSPHGAGKSSILHAFETFVHSVLLPELVSKLLDRIVSVVNTKLEVKVQLDMLPINELTWPEVVRRYIMAYLLMGGRLGSLKIADSNKTKLIHCLQSDCGSFSGSPTNVADIDLDAQLLGRAVNKVFGKMKSGRNTLSMGIRGDSSDVSIPDWAKVLDPVKKLPTNVGSRIRNCVYEALNRSPPEWAKKLLEASISKDVYKCNASGPTKRAVIEVLKRAASDVPRRPLSLDGNIRTSCELLISQITMKKCRSILRNVAANYDSKWDFSNLMRNNLKSDEIKVVFKSASRRPLDFPTVDLRLLHDTYCGSPQAFLEDVRELWINLKKTHMNASTLVTLVDDMSKDFDLKYKNEVSPLLSKLSEYEKFNAEGEKELEEHLASIEIPKLSLEAGICKVCGVNQDDDRVLLCDTEWCNAEYHTYCLNPPLSEIPQGHWYCPACKQLASDRPKGVPHILQFVDKSCHEEAYQYLDILTSLEEKGYWQLEPDKKLFLLKFLVDKSLDTNLIRKNLGESRTKLGKKFLGIDSVGRIYWGFPCVGIVINLLENTKISPIDHPASHLQYDDCGQWYLLRTDEEIKELLDCLSRSESSDQYQIELRDSILVWQKTMSKSGQRTCRKKLAGREAETVYSQNCLNTKATVLLEAQYGSFMEPDAAKYIKKPCGKNMAKCHRCDCLEPVFPSRHHCANCHQTFFTSIEFEHHKISTCQITLDSGHDGAHDTNRTGVDCLNQVGNSDRLGEEILRPLMISLLDMEAALPDGAKRCSMSSPEWRSGWCSFVKSAKTIYEIVEATLALETMIKTEYVNNSWWWYWSSVSAAAKTSTISALAFRIYTLDAAIKYQQTATTTDEQRSRRVKQTLEKAKEQKKEREPAEKVDL